MPEETTNDTADEPIKCDVCLAVCTDEVHSSDNYDTICSDCYDTMFNCEFCNTISDESYTTVMGDEVCSSCSEDCHSCYGCDQLIHLGRHDYHENPHDYLYCCSSCARDTEMYDCNECGCSIYFSESGEDWADDNMCYDCYNNKESHISDEVSKTIKVPDVPLSSHYTNASSSVLDFFAMFYGDSYSTANLENNSNQLQKSGGGYGKGYGYYNTSIEVASETIDRMGKHIYKIIRSRRMFCDHRKYGIYNPMLDFFKDAVTFVDEKTGKYINGSDISMQMFGKNFYDYSVSSIDRAKINDMLTQDLKNKNELRNKIIKAMNGSMSNRLPLLMYSDDPYYADFEKFKCNSAASQLKVKIGFDPDDMAKVLEFNRAVGSCQVRSNAETYAFGMMDMVCNPHLLYLIYDKDILIGRAVIRIFKAADDEFTYVAPSRLYLTKFTHIKNSLYNSMFGAVSEWANLNFGPKSVKMLAYTATRHDSAAVWDYLDKNKYRIDGDATHKTVYTNWWHQWWNVKPSSEEADMLYYKDETMYSEHARVARGDDNVIPDYAYASRERLNSRHYYIVEELNNTNE